MSFIMEVNIICQETVKPSSPTPISLGTFELSFLDQLIPTFYSPLILFCSNEGGGVISQRASSVLRASLSEALSCFYPLAGRRQGHNFIDCNDEGALFSEAQVLCPMREFLINPEIGMLDKLLPARPFVKQSDPLVAQVAVQVNTFECGGIAIGLCVLHTVIDAITMSHFLSYWAGIARGLFSKELPGPDFGTASSLFPARDPLPDSFLKVMERGWFKEGKFVTRRFVFDQKSIAALRDRAREGGPTPTRYETVSGFIWEHATRASREKSRMSISIHSIDMRQRMKNKSIFKYSVGNLLWSAVAAYDPSNGTNVTFPHLVRLIKESIGRTNGDYLGSLVGDRGFKAIYDGLERMVESFPDDGEGPEVFGFSNWSNMGFDEIDFGWGKPKWTGLWGGRCDAFRNLVVLKKYGHGIEAWATLEEDTMRALEKDGDFVEFATINPSISY